VRLLLVAFAALALAGVAAAATPLEQRLGEVATLVAGRTAQVRCYDEAGWAALGAAEGWNPAEVFGGVVFGTTLAELSPRVCTALAAYIAAPPARACSRATTRTVTRRVWRRVRVRGTWTRKRVAVRVKVRTTSPVGCAPPGDSLIALWTLAHESFHVAGIKDEATADCWGIQAMELVALRLGAHPLNARRMGEAAYLHSTQFPRPGYTSPECRQGGALDRSPADGRFP
jgi:hypothetical protein